MRNDHLNWKLVEHIFCIFCWAEFISFNTLTIHSWFTWHTCLTHQLPIAIWIGPFVSIRFCLEFIIWRHDKEVCLKTHTIHLALKQSKRQKRSEKLCFLIFVMGPDQMTIKQICIKDGQWRRFHQRNRSAWAVIGGENARRAHFNALANQSKWIYLKWIRRW